MDDTELAQAKIVETVNLMLSGQMSYIEGARRVTGMADTAGFDRLSEPFVAFVTIDSETDAVPIGKVRERWDADAIAKHMSEWERSEAYAKQYGEPACHEVLALLVHGSS